jgi:ATP-grasp domain/L-amino acid ligase C-terminal domain 2
MTCAIVDGYSGGRHLGERLSARGEDCVHLHSSPDVAPAFSRSFRAEGFSRDLGYVTDLATTARALADLGVRQVVPGAESGVEPAERLAHALGLPANGDRPSRLRRDKSLAAQALRRAGLAAPRGTSVRTAAEAVAWATEEGGGPFVVKPLDSCASDHVFFCSSASEIAAAVESVIGARTICGGTNRAALVQERLFGTEYYLNTVSVEGRHRVVETWRYAKLSGPDNSVLYDYEEPVDHSSPEVAELHDYVRRALAVLGVCHGAAHTEVMLTGRGPVLLDCGARLCGACVPAVIEEEVGFSQLSVLVEALLRPEALEEFDESSWAWPHAFRNVFLINDRAGTAGELDIEDELRALPSFVDLVLAIEPGRHVPLTTDLFSSPGYVYLSAPDREELERDYLRVRALERESPFVPSWARPSPKMGRPAHCTAPSPR